MSNVALREDLLGGAATIEMETQGYLPARTFDELIDKIILPQVDESEELAQFLPLNICVDRHGKPADVSTNKAEIGAVAIFETRSIFAWSKGVLRVKLGSHVLKHSDVETTSVWTENARDWRGVDIKEQGKESWSVIFGERLNPNLTLSWARELADRLDGSWSNETVVGDQRDS